MASFSELAQKKVAGIPVLYVAGAFVVILAIVAYKMKPASSEDSGPVDETQGESPDQTGGAADYSGLETQGTVTVVQGSPNTSEPVKATNDDWERSAVEYLIEAKLATPSDAQVAIHRYLEGADLTYEQGKLKDAAITKLKLPPEPLTTIGTIGNAPAQKQFSNYPGKHTVKGSNDNTPYKLAGLYYGSTNAEHANRIVASNAKLGPVGTTYSAGSVIYIPAWVTPRYYVITNTTRYPGAAAAKNGIPYDAFLALNPGLVAPYKVGSKVRVA